MRVSVETLRDWIENENNNNNTESSDEKAAKLLDHLRQIDKNHGGDSEKDSRNIQDFLKTLTQDELLENLDSARSEMVNIFLNVAGDFNLATGIRNAAWYNVKETYIVGRRKWDRRGAVGSHHYVPVHREPDIFEVIKTLRADGYTIVAAEINDTAVPLTTYEWNTKTAVIYGEESAGVPDDVVALLDDVIYIPGRGAIRSLNVGTTSGIFMNDYHAKLGLLGE